MKYKLILRLEVDLIARTSKEAIVEGHNVVEKLGEDHKGMHVNKFSIYAWGPDE